LILRGTVESGKAQGSEYIRLTWVRKQIENNLSFSPFPGTLNVKLNKKETKKLKEGLKKAQSIEIAPEARFYPGKCYRASINDETTCAIVVPELSDYPEDLVEIISPDNLRKKLGLADGDKVQIKILV